MNRDVLTIPENHPDLAILCAKTSTNISDLRGASNPFKEFNYLKVYHFKTWCDVKVAAFKDAIEAANKEAKEYQFKLNDVTDFEVEFDDDRTWPAAFSFESHRKTN